MTQTSVTNGEYRTTPRKVSWFARMFPSFSFHSRMAGIIWRASKKASRGLYNDDEWVKSSWEVVHALERVGVELEVTGLQHLEGLDSPCLVIGNHMSTLETAVMPGLVQPYRDVTFVVKESLLDYPVFKHVMRSRTPIPVTQTNARDDFRAMMEGGMERLEKGISLIIFPEGRRTLNFAPEEFNTVGVKLARRAGVPIVPFVLETSAWGLGWLLSDVGKIDPTRKVRIEFGEPLTVEGRGTEEHEEIVQFILTKLREWGEESSAATEPAEPITLAETPTTPS